MLLHIVRKELLDQLLSLRFAIACGVCLIVFLLSAVVLTRDYREGLATYNMNRVLHRNEVEQGTQRSDLYQGVTVDRPPNLMNTLVRGLSKELTESVHVSNHSPLDFPEGWQQSPVLPLFPPVDFVFIVGVILSLLALAFAYDTVSGEAESGVLKLLMSYSAPRDLVLLGKWLGGYLALIGPFTVSFVLVLLVMLLFPDVEPDGESSLALVALYGLALLYLGAVYSLGLFVSCRTRLASTSITVLLLLWVTLILAVPNMAPYAVSQLVPIPSASEVDREKQALKQERIRRDKAFIKEEQERLGYDDVRQVWKDESVSQRLRESREEAQAKIQKIEDSFRSRLAAQTRLSAVLARLSPVTSFNLAACDLAAAGIAQEEEWVESLKAFNDTWHQYVDEKSRAYNQFINRKFLSTGSLRLTQAEQEQFENVDMSDAPRFHFTHMSVSDRLAGIYIDLALLALWNVAFFMLAYLSFLRYEIN